MTYKQTQHSQKLQAKIAEASNAFQANTDRAKHDKLAKEWQDAIDRWEKFTSKFD
jgi:hypothetical protein